MAKSKPKTVDVAVLDAAIATGERYVDETVMWRCTAKKAVEMLEHGQTRAACELLKVASKIAVEGNGEFPH